MQKIISFLLFYLLSLPLLADTHTAGSCSIADINTAITAAENGDTVSVPAGDCDWNTSSAYVLVNKSIILIGAGSGPEGTNITNTAGNADYRYNGIYVSANDVRISGFSFTNTSATYDYFVYIATGLTGWRIDNNIFSFFKWSIISDDTDENNLIDNNTFYGGGVQLDYGLGATAWAADTVFGTNNFTFIEDNVFSDQGSLETFSRPVLTYSGRKVVFRYNTVKLEDTGTYKGITNHFIDAHGYGHASSENAGRGTRAIEIYNNTVVVDGGTANYAQSAVNLRSGTGLMYNNVVWPSADYQYSSPFYMYDWRAGGSGASATIASVYGVAPNTDAKLYCHNPGVRLAVDRTSTSYFGSTIIGAESGASAVIVGWQSDYLYFESVSGGPFTSGENLTISGTVRAVATADSESYSGEGYPCVDQVGRGKEQASEPVYMWNNKDTDGNFITTAANGFATGYLTENTDYFISETKPEALSAYTPYGDYVDGRYYHPMQGKEATPGTSTQTGRMGINVNGTRNAVIIPGRMGITTY